MLEGGLDVVLDGAIELGAVRTRTAGCLCDSRRRRPRIMAPRHRRSGRAGGTARPVEAIFAGAFVAMPPGGFLQASGQGEAALVEAVVAAVAPQRTAVDPFAGARAPSPFLWLAAVCASTRSMPTTLAEGSGRDAARALPGEQRRHAGAATCSLGRCWPRSCGASRRLSSTRPAPAPASRPSSWPAQRCRLSSPCPATRAASPATPASSSKAAIAWSGSSRSTSSCGRPISNGRRLPAVALRCTAATPTRPRSASTTGTSSRWPQRDRGRRARAGLWSGSSCSPPVPRRRARLQAERDRPVRSGRTRSCASCARPSPVPKVSRDGQPSTAKQARPPRSASKQARLIVLLQRGASISDMSREFGWLRHTCHGALAGLKKNAA